MTDFTVKVLLGIPFIGLIVFFYGLATISIYIAIVGCILLIGPPGIVMIYAANRERR